PLSSTTSRCSITDDAATLFLGTSVLSSLKGGGLRQAEDPVNPLQPSPILSTKPGQLQIVVTDLFSHAMPLIRYEIGDLGILGSRECECGCSLPVLEELHGRIVEQVFNP